LAHFFAIFLAIKHFPKFNYWDEASGLTKSTQKIMDPALPAPIRALNFEMDWHSRFRRLCCAVAAQTEGLCTRCRLQDGIRAILQRALPEICPDRRGFLRLT
jgi:hypothetical protein